MYRFIVQMYWICVSGAVVMPVAGLIYLFLGERFIAGFFAALGCISIVVVLFYRWVQSYRGMSLAQIRDELVDKSRKR